MLGDMASGVTQTVLLQLSGIFVMAISQRQGGAATVGTALHGLFQMWDELMSGLGHIQTSPEGLDVLSALVPGHVTPLHGPWPWGFCYPSLLLALVSSFPKSLQGDWGGPTALGWGQGDTWVL